MTILKRITYKASSISIIVLYRCLKTFCIKDEHEESKRHYKHEESRRIKEEMKREGKEMKVGDIIIEKKVMRIMHRIFEINAKRGNRFCVTPVLYRPKFVSSDEFRIRIKKEYVRYDISFNYDRESSWEREDVLYENYEKFDEGKIYEIPS